MPKLSRPHNRHAIYFLIFGLVICIIIVNPVYSCGWWGDGEMSKHGSILEITHGDIDVPQNPTLENARLPGRLGYGIAVIDPGRAIPYLRATGGLQFNKIAELKSFGFESVIDLGTAEKSAKLHRRETEVLAMTYVSIPVEGQVPSPEQIQKFTNNIVALSRAPLLVYAPDSILLGTMWAAHRINLGAPIEFSIQEGIELGMKYEQEMILRRRLE